MNDIYSYLYHLETVYAIEKNHLEGQRDVLPKMRAVLMDWINEVHLQYHFVQETFHMAVSIIDRYLQVNIHNDQLPHDVINISSPTKLTHFPIFTTTDGKIDVTPKFAIGWCCRPIHFVEI